MTTIRQLHPLGFASRSAADAPTVHAGHGADSHGSDDKVVSLANRGAPDYDAMLAGVARGDRQAEARLMQALSGPLITILRQRLRRIDGVDDYAQEALIVVLQAAREGRFKDGRALIGFTMVTMNNLLTNEERRRARQQTYASASLDDVIEASEEATTLAANSNASFDQAELHDCIGAVLSALHSPRDREMLRDYYLRETPSDELQARLALNTVQFAKVLHRARTRFGQLWQSLKFEMPAL